MAIKINRLIAALQKLPQDSLCYAYEGLRMVGERTGVVVVSPDGKGADLIPASEAWDDNGKPIETDLEKEEL